MSSPSVYEKLRGKLRVKVRVYFVGAGCREGIICDEGDKYILYEGLDACLPPGDPARDYGMQLMDAQVDRVEVL